MGLSFWGLWFIILSNTCGVCQFLRAWDDKYGRRLYTALRLNKVGIGFNRFGYALSLGFMFTEHALFMVFLLGMTSGLAQETAQ